MTFPSTHYRSFTSLLLEEKDESGQNITEWSKIREADRIAGLLYDQIIGPSSAGTKTRRAQALLKYLNVKKSMVDPGPATVEAREYTLTNALYEYEEIQFGLCGRFHRVVMAVYNEVQSAVDSTDESEPKGMVFALWCNKLALGLTTVLGYVTPPIIMEATYYKINEGPIVEPNPSNNVHADSGNNILLITNGLNFVSTEWHKDGNPTGITTEHLYLEGLSLADEGVYTNVYTNNYGDTISTPFDLSI